jgi:hypothetical protein
VSNRATGPHDEVGALRAENARLRRDLEELRSSTSFRVGDRLVRGVGRLLPGRRRDTSSGGTGEPGGGGPARGPRVEVSSADDVLVQARGVAPEALTELIRRVREELPEHASLVVGH